MTNKEKQAAGEKFIRVLQELKDMDLDGIPLITFEEFEKLRQKKEWIAGGLSFLIGVGVGMLTIALLDVTFHVDIFKMR